MSHHKNAVSETLKNWLPLAAVIVIFSLLAYCLTQQNYRQSANDPQAQIAEDLADAIEQGAPAESIAPATGSTDIKKSLSPFILIYSEDGTLIGSTAVLDGQNPQYPSEDLDVAKQNGKHNTTWEPQPGVKIATVVAHYGGEAPGFVVAGRSLREVEARVKQMMQMTAVSGLAALVLSFGLVFLMKKSDKEAEHKHTETV